MALPADMNVNRDDGIIRRKIHLQTDDVDFNKVLLQEINHALNESASNKQLVLDKFREKIQRMQARMVEQMDISLTELVGEVLQEVEQTTLSPEHLYNSVEGNLKYKNRVKTKGTLSDKQFLPRNSVLTDLFQIKHIRTIYNIFCVILIILFLNTAVYDLVTTGKLNLGIELIVWNFTGLQTAVLIWLGMMSTTIVLFSCFSLWANKRVCVAANSVARKYLDYGGLLAFVVYLTMFCCVPVAYIYKIGLNPGASITLLMEQVRLLMKSYAFVRSNAPKTMAFKTHTDSKEEPAPCPEFSCFLYYLFAPTLVYRDNYPRKKETNWLAVVWHFTEVIGVVFYVAFIFDRFLIPMFRDFGRKPLHSETLVVDVFGAMMPGTLAFLCGFFCLLHSWMNAFAEMLRFGDRMFYKDWWNATSYAAYYRTWNVVVHDWLYTYVYKDFCEVFQPKTHFVPTMLVFLISAVVHEFILAFTFRFFYPMLFLAFGGFGASLVFLPRDVAGSGNIIMWLLLCIGNGILTSAYSMEWYARINCQQTLDPFWDFFVPRSWNCQPLLSVNE